MSDVGDGGASTQRKVSHQQKRSSASAQQMAQDTPRISIEDFGATSSGTSSEHYPFPDMSFKHKFKSYRLRGEYEKPWLQDPNLKSTKWNNLIVCIFMFLGFLGAGGIAFSTVWPYRTGDVGPASKYLLRS